MIVTVGMLMLAACASDAPGGGQIGNPGTPPTPPGGAPPGNGGPGATPPGGGVGVSGFCSGSGPIVDLGAVSAPGAPGNSCDGDSFAAAVCSCSDLKVQGFLAVSSLDPAAPSAGSVDANGGAEIFGYADVGGSLRAAGQQPLGFYGYLHAGGDLEAAGRVAVSDSSFAAGYLQVDGDARIGGDLALYGYAAIGGDLTQPAGAGTPTVLEVGGVRIAAPVPVAPPCACGADVVPDLAGLVADARNDNDNAALVPALPPRALADVIGVASVTLPCGHYYLDEIAGAGVIAVRVTGRVALFVGGDVNPTGLFVIQVDPGAELDLVIGGNLRATGAGSFGSWDQPGATRIYVAGGDEVKLTGASGFAGNLYAPHATVRGTGATFVRGSLFGRRIEIPGFLSVGYDPSVRGDQCPPIIP